MARTQIAISIAADGTVSAETRNIKGARCLDLIPQIEALVDGETVDSAFTSEFYETETATTNEAEQETPTTRRVWHQASIDTETRQQ